MKGKHFLPRQRRATLTSFTSQVGALAAAWDKRPRAAFALLAAMALLVALTVSYTLARPAETLVAEHTYSYEDAAIAARIELPDDAGVPSSARLSVAELDDSAASKAAGEVAGAPAEQVRLYDISFYDTDGGYISVPDEATVSLSFKDGAGPSGEVQVLHFESGGEAPVVLDEVEAQQDEQGTVTDVSFTTQGFSVFAVVSVTSTASYDELTVTDSTDLDGQSFVIVSSTKNKALGNTVTGNGITKLDVTVTDDSSMAACPQWIFTKNADGTYLIHTVIGSTATYLTMNGTSGVMGLTAENSSATHFTLTAHNDMAVIGYGGRYINNFGGDNVYAYFAGWTSGTGDDGSHLRLYKQSLEGILSTELGGQSFAIVSNTSDKAITTGSATVNGMSGLASKEVTITDGYVVGDVPLWKFDAVTNGSDGQYYVSTVVGGVTKYLYFLESSYTSPSDGRGSLTLSDSPQAITVTATGDGTVYLSATVNEKTGYINQNDGNGDFWVYNAAAPSCKLRLCKETSISAGLLYDINLPSLVTVNGSSKSWYNNKTPAIDSPVQEISAGMSLKTPSEQFAELGISGEIYKEQHPDVADADNPFYNLYRMWVNTPGNLVTNNLPTAHMNEEEYLFYWTYTLDGNKHCTKPLRGGLLNQEP